MRVAKASGANLVVFPENANRERDYFVDGKASREKAWELCERVDGRSLLLFLSSLSCKCACKIFLLVRFVTVLQNEAKNLGMFQRTSSCLTCIYTPGIVVFAGVDIRAVVQ